MYHPYIIPPRSGVAVLGKEGSTENAPGLERGQLKRACPLVRRLVPYQIGHEPSRETRVFSTF